MKRNQQKRPRILPERHVNGSKGEERRKPRERPSGWMRDGELDRSINAAVQDGEDSDDR